MRPASCRSVRPASGWAATHATISSASRPASRRRGDLVGLLALAQRGDDAGVEVELQPRRARAHEEGRARGQRGLDEQPPHAGQDARQRGLRPCLVAPRLRLGADVRACGRSIERDQQAQRPVRRDQQAGRALEAEQLEAAQVAQVDRRVDPQRVGARARQAAAHRIDPLARARRSSRRRPEGRSHAVPEQGEAVGRLVGEHDPQVAGRDVAAPAGHRRRGDPLREQAVGRVGRVEPERASCRPAATSRRRRAPRGSRRAARAPCRAAARTPRRTRAAPPPARRAPRARPPVRSLPA